MLSRSSRLARMALRLATIAVALVLIGEIGITAADPDDDGAPKAAALQAGDKVERVPTRKGVEVAVLVRAPDKATAVVLLYPGGGGRLGLGEAGIQQEADNFTVRTRGAFASAGFVAVVVDAPSDHNESLSRYRITADASADTAHLVTWAVARWNLPVWLVGTSRGTISVGNAAARGVRVRGIVLTSSVTTGKKEKATLGDVAMANIRVPTLLIHHDHDVCPASPLDGAFGLVSRLEQTGDVAWRVLSGGDTDESASTCSPRAHHGFLGQDAQVVGIIAEFIRKP